jgi:hypothetical protein
MNQSQLLAMLTGGRPQDSASTPAPAPAEPAATSSNSESSAASIGTPQPTTPAPASAPTPAAHAPRAGAGGTGGAVSSASLAAILSNLGSGGGGLAQAQAEAMKGASLLDVMDSKGVLEALADLPDSGRARLLEELPPGDRTPEGLREVGYKCYVCTVGCLHRAWESCMHRDFRARETSCVSMWMPRV